MNTDVRRRTLLRAALGTAFAGAAGFGTASLWLRPAHQRQGLREFAAADLAFGTTVSLKVLHTDEATAQRAMQAALVAVRDIDRLMSLYRADSEISRLNRDGRLAYPDPRVLAVLQHAQALSQGTGGAFDVTVQPLWLAAASGGAALVAAVSSPDKEFRPLAGLYHEVFNEPERDAVLADVVRWINARMS